MMKFNFLDALFLAMFILGGYFGYRLGPLKKSLTLGVLIVAIVVGFRTMIPIAGVIALTGLSLPASGAIAFVLVVLAIMTSTILLLRKFGKPTGAKTPGRVTASVIGVLEGALAISALLLVLKLTDIPKASTRENSLMYRPLVNLLPITFDTLRHALPGGSEMEEEFSGPRGRGI
jgi:uncharacterized membrane protein required for colicin V production